MSPDRFKILIEKFKDAVAECHKTLLSYLENKTRLESNLSIYNHTNLPLGIAFRDGSRMVIKPMRERKKTTSIIERGCEADLRSFYRDHVIFVRQYKTLDADYKAEVDIQYLSDANFSHPDTEEAVRQHITHFQASVGSEEFGRYPCVVYLVHINEILRAEGSFFIKNLDLTVATKFDNTIFYHPAATRKETLERIGNNAPVRCDGLLYYIADRESRYGTRYYVSGNEIRKVIPDMSGTEPDGVYIVDCDRQGNQTREPILLEEAEEKLPWLFPSEALARHHLNHGGKLAEIDLTEKKTGLEYAKLDSQLEKLKLEHEVKVAEYELKVREKDMKIEFMEKELQTKVRELANKEREHQEKQRREREEFERRRQEDFITMSQKWRHDEAEHLANVRRESQSQSIKHAHDWFKLIPVALTALGAWFIYQSKKS